MATPNSFIIGQTKEMGERVAPPERQADRRIRGGMGEVSEVRSGAA